MAYSSNPDAEWLAGVIRENPAPVRLSSKPGTFELLLEGSGDTITTPFEFPLLQEVIERETDAGIPVDLSELFGLQSSVFHLVEPAEESMRKGQHNHLLIADAGEVGKPEVAKAMKTIHLIKDGGNVSVIRFAGIVPCGDGHNRIAALEFMKSRKGKWGATGFDISGNGFPQGIISDNFGWLSLAEIPTKSKHPRITTGIITPAMVDSLGLGDDAKVMRASAAASAPPFDVKFPDNIHMPSNPFIIKREGDNYRMEYRKKNIVGFPAKL